MTELRTPNPNKPPPAQKPNTPKPQGVPGVSPSKTPGQPKQPRQPKQPK